VHLRSGEGPLSAKDAGDPVAHTKDERQRERNGKVGGASRQEAKDGAVWLRLGGARPERLVDEHEIEAYWHDNTTMNE